MRDCWLYEILLVFSLEYKFGRNKEDILNALRTNKVEWGIKRPRISNICQLQHFE